MMEEFYENLPKDERPSKEIMNAMREPLITRWWTVGALSSITMHFLDLFTCSSNGERSC
jgi:hypothetical protein